MQSHPGLFIVIEGVDGSGKTTQFDLLKKRLEDEGHSVEVFKFPRYAEASSYFIKKYLDGGYGPASGINPYTSTLFYALDRYEASSQIRKALQDGKIVLSDRYVGSNMAHQGSKIPDNIDKRSFFVWEDSLEFQLLNIPRPTINLFLRVPTEISFELIGSRTARDYTDKTRDEHEADINHLKQSLETYDLLCQLFPKDFKAIDCVDSGKLLGVKKISDLIWQQIEEFLPTTEIQEPKQKNEKPKESPQEPKPASSEGDWKVTGLSLHALISLKMFGLDISFNGERTWAGNGSSYKFFTPNGLNKNALEAYVTTYKKVSDIHKNLHSHMVKYFKAQGSSSKAANSLATNLCLNLVPMGALFSCSVHLEKSSVEKILPKLSAHPDGEIRTFGSSLGEMAKKTWSDLRISQAPSTSAPQSINAILANLADSNLPQHLSTDDPARLLEVSPKNEFELLADGIYPFSDLSREEIKAAVTHWDYQQKARTLSDALRANSTLLELATYRFDVLIDRVSLMSLLGSLTSANSQLQQSTVRYGYEVPEAIEAAGEEERYMEAFDLFLELYSQLQTSETTEIFDYATLAGHKVRWQASLSGAALAGLRETTGIDVQIKSYITELAAQAHPIIGEYIAKPIQKTTKRVAAKKRRD